MTFAPFGKILALGHRCIRDIFEDGPVEITEKIDGSQFGFGSVFGEVGCRSKGRMIQMDNPDKMFAQATEQVERVSDILPENTKFYGEYLNKPKHNVIEYSTYPKNHIVLFGMESSDPKWKYSRLELEFWAKTFGFDIVPRLFQGKMETGMSVQFLEELLDTDSYLGGSKIEGFVIKNWAKEVSLPAGVSWPMSAKFVSEKFKEKMGQGKQSRKGTNAFTNMKDQYQTEARWQKAVQHLRDDGKLLGEPKDIGPLMKAVNMDIIEECKDEIMHELWAIFHKEITKHATMGLPEWYKKQLAMGEVNSEPGGYTRETWNEMVASVEGGD
ncbi:hypothetical protein KAR91_65390 [Candidatus Pacearchaeota archaeon]|nr:hypothetical protein [Candidatus Pacearchaeota archaeon]